MLACFNEAGCAKAPTDTDSSSAKVRKFVEEYGKLLDRRFRARNLIRRDD